MNRLKQTVFVTSLLVASVAQADLAYSFSFLDTLGGTNGGANHINNARQVVGFSETVGGSATRATLWNGTTVTDLGTLGGSNSAAYSVNDSGQSVGWSNTNGDKAAPGTLWNGTMATQLHMLPGGRDNLAFDINNAGQAVGWTETGGRFSKVRHATLWNGDTATDLGSLHSNSEARAINTTGQVVGYSYVITDGSYLAHHATLWNGTAITDLGTLGGKDSLARGINDAGQVVGFSSTTGEAGVHATLWNGTTITDLGTLGGRGSDAVAINNAGQVVGFSDTVGNGVVHATLWNGTTATDLNSFLSLSEVNAGWVLGNAIDINDRGDIVGNAFNSQTWATRGFLLSATEVPDSEVSEPESYALVLVGLALIGGMSRRRKLLF